MVAAGVRPRARSTSAATSRAESSAPVAALASHGGCSPAAPARASMPQAYRPASVPSSTPAAYCIGSRRRCSRRFRLQAVTSQASVAGRAPPVSKDTRASHSPAVAAPNSAPTASTPSTNSTARSTTPTWQASNTSARAAGAGASEGSRGRVDKICVSCIAASA